MAFTRSFPPITQLSRPNNSLLAGATSDDDGRPPSGRTTITSRAANATTVAVETARPSILVLSGVSFPGWRVRVDGKAAELLRVDYLLRGVAVPQGHHNVEVYYSETSFRFGLLTPSLAAFGWCLIFFRSLEQAK